MNAKKIILTIIASVLFLSFINGKGRIDVYTPPGSGALEMEAAGTLCAYLNNLYEDYRFVPSTQLTDRSKVVIGCLESMNNDAALKSKLPAPPPNGFLITSAENSGSIKKFIIGSNPRSVVDAVYSLLEKLGYGFYLSHDTKPVPLKKLDFDRWELSDYPLAEDRVVFNWHNFLSGCTGWSLPEWKTWIDQSSKMRYNAIMVHAYGNNPLFQFEMNGIKKPVGYMNTSNSGRDWGGQHVNDVRLLSGGAVFKDAIFGSPAAIVPDSLRVGSAVDMMQQVFRYATQKGMNIIFALDFDTESSNPQQLILSLPESARFLVKNIWLVNPETPEGYAYYKTQIKKLMSDYPQINKLALWSRANNTPWHQIQKETLIPEWKKEYYHFVSKEGRILDDNLSASLFCQSKVIKAYQKALKELGYDYVEIMYGTWGWDNMVPANYIFPKEVGFIPLDWWINFDYEATEYKLAHIGKERKLIPIVWAHHDDHRYIGRPYTPYSGFEKMLRSRNAAGFGIIHWTTFPLDLYFTSSCRQVWNNSNNESLRSTVQLFVRQHWGAGQPLLEEYFYEWLIGAPMFGMETGNHFMQPGGNKIGIEEPEDSKAIVEKAHRRVNLLKRVDTQSIKRNKDLLSYFEKSERFYIAFFENQIHFRQAYDYLSQNKIAEAQQEIARTDCKKVIEMYADALLAGPATTGEKAIVFSLGTRWYPDYINLGQRAGMEAINIRFGITRHDELAQGAGAYTWYLDQNRTLWRVMGKKELGSGIKETEGSILVPESLTIKLTTFTNNPLPAGKYRVTLSALRPCQPFPEIRVISGSDISPIIYSTATQEDKIKFSFDLSIDSNPTSIILDTKGDLELLEMTLYALNVNAVKR